MTDSQPAASTPTAGALLRAAREQQGIHLAALAAAIKVAPRKLEALENDRWAELTDATFVRALAQTVCRSLKIDAGPVLALLPAAAPISLVPMGNAHNLPFHDRSGSGDRGLASGAIRPMLWAAGVLMVAAVVVYFVPADLLTTASTTTTTASAPEPLASDTPPPLELLPIEADVTAGGAFAAPAGSEPPPVGEAPALPMAATPAPSPAPATAAAAPLMPPPSADPPSSRVSPSNLPLSSLPLSALPLTSAPPTPAPVAALPPAAAPLPAAPVQPVAGPAAPAAAAVPPATTAPVAAASASGGGLQMSSSAPSWVEVRDARGEMLMSRTLLPGESVALEGALPLRLTIGNAAATRIAFRGQAIDLASRTRDNVARLEVQ